MRGHVHAVGDAIIGVPRESCAYPHECHADVGAPTRGARANAVHLVSGTIGKKNARDIAEKAISRHSRRSCAIQSREPDAAKQHLNPNGAAMRQRARFAA